jgi:hypothetical protein
MKRFENYTNRFKKFIDGSYLRHAVKGQWRFFMYLELLAILYITNQFAYERIFMDKEKLKKEINELKSESVTVAAKLMELSKESQVEKEVNKRGINLMISDTPPQEIIIPKEKQ